MCHNNEPLPLADGEFRHDALHVFADRGLRGGLGCLVVGVQLERKVRAHFTTEIEMLTDERINELAWVARSAGPDVMALVNESVRQAAIEATNAERVACCKAIDAIDDGEAPEYRACQEAIMERSNV